jgi:hypothetical protein
MSDQLILSHSSKIPQFLSITPNADLRKVPAQSTKPALEGSHARFKSIDLNIVDSIVSKHYRSTSQQPDLD